MLEQLRRLYPYPNWADERYRRLAFLDACLDGDLFMSLRGSFYDDTTLISTGRKAKLTDRKPSVRYNVARQVAKQTARKLFSGRHAPRFMHPSNPKLALAAEALMREGFLKTRILQAVTWGSVGSVAITFTILPGGENIPRIVFNVYRARMCWPTVDALGELKALRLWYVITPDAALRLAAKDFLGNAIKRDSQYWFIRDYLPGREITYVPVEVGSKKGDLPLDQVVQTYDAFRPLNDFDISFDVPLVPAQWFVNLAGGEFPDGASTWEDALPGMIEMAFTLSQLGRGVRYNATPQLVVVGKPQKDGTPYAPGQARFNRDAAEVLQVPAATEDSGGKKTGQGDAKLLEMRGNAVAAALKYCEAVRKYTLEQIGGSRKDPDRLHFPQSGKAMEHLDEDFFDLVGELRTSYGDYGLVPLMKKAITVASAAGHPLVKNVDVSDLDALALKWPRPYLPTAQEFQQLMQGLAMGVNGGAAAGKGTDGAALPPKVVLTPAQAHRLLDEYLGIDLDPETPSVALQQQPREEEIPTLQPEQTNGAGAGGSALQPTGKDLPAKKTILAPAPYTQQ